MCRLAAFIGTDEIALSALLYDAPHSLQHAAYQPRELLRGTVNVDGTGAAWWPRGAKEPLRYVTTQPPWSDPNLPGLAPALRGSTILSAVRSATPGLPFGTDNVAPFVSVGFAAIHNGWIGGFRDGLGRQLVSRLSDQRFGELSAMNDSLALFLLVMQQIDDNPTIALVDAVDAVISDVAKAVVAAGSAATLNLVVASSDEIVAARTSVNFEINSLYSRQNESGSWIASEPLDDVGWTPVADHALLKLDQDGIAVRTLDHAGVPR